jgi:hypothetical protein
MEMKVSQLRKAFCVVLRALCRYVNDCDGFFISIAAGAAQAMIR